MLAISSLAEQDRAAITVRLNRIEGQVRGVQRMVAADRDHRDILTQIDAIRAATSALVSVMVKALAFHSLGHRAEFAAPEIAIEQAMRAFTTGRGTDPSPPAADTVVAAPGPEGWDG